jgi:hypothetical protein
VVIDFIPTQDSLDARNGEAGDITSESGEREEPKGRDTMTSTHTLARPAEETHGPLSWFSPEAKLWVASREGDFAGFVEFTDNHYDATDARGAQLASCGTLGQAQDLIEQSTRRASAVTTLAYVAVGTGAIAVSALAAGLGFVIPG